MEIKFTPNSAHRWVSCHASAILPGRMDDVPDARRDDADEGVAAHFVACQYAQGKTVEVGSIAPNGHAVTADMVEHAQTWAYYTAWTADPVNAGGLETRLDLGQAFGVNGNAFVDAWGVSHGTLHVYEYKYGFSEVSAFKNWQMIMYAAALIAKGGVPVTSVTLHVIQPRAFKPTSCDTWETTTEKLAPYIQQLKDAISDIKAGSVSAKIGKHCKHCPARHACSELREFTLAEIDVSAHAELVDMTPEVLGFELDILKRAIDLLEMRKSGLEEMVTHKIKAGVPVPGWTLASRLGRAEWVVDPSVVALLGDANGVDLRKPMDTLTPAQALKALPALKGSIEALSKRSETALKLEKLDMNKIKERLKK